MVLSTQVCLTDTLVRYGALEVKIEVIHVTVLFVLHVGPLLEGSIEEPSGMLT